MVDITIYVRNMTKEQWQKKLGWLTINDEPADMGIASKLIAIIQPGPDTTRYVDFDYTRIESIKGEISEALSHLERIANGFDHENDALLYVNINNKWVRDIALNIVKYGKESVWWKYEVPKTEEAA
jgi:hypothetical protein